jgi:spermidine/putrescine-binding protein
LIEMTYALRSAAPINRRNFLKLAFGVTAAAAALARPRRLHWASGGLRLGLWSSDDGRNLLDGFEERTGLHVSPSPHPSNEAILADLRAGADYDVVVLTAYAVAEGVGEALIRRLEKARLPNFAGLPVEFRDGHRAHDPEDAFSAPKTWGTTGILYRTDVFGRAPASWADFWAMAEGHSGRAFVIDSAPEVVGAALYKIGYPPTEHAPEHLEQARSELLKLAKHLGGIDSDCASRLASGDGVLALSWSTEADRLMAAGIPVGFAIPAEGSEIWEDDYCIPANAGDPAASHEFINYMLAAAPPALPQVELPFERLLVHTPLEAEVTAIRDQIWRDVRAA